MASRRQQITVLLLFVPVVLGAAFVRAGSLAWDTDSGTGGAQGGSGTWNTNSTANWWDGSANAVWPAPGGTDDDAVFDGIAGAVTITSATVNELFFNTSGYTLSGGTLTFNGITPAISNGPGVDASISSVIAGADGLTKTGGGMLTLSGANTYAGLTTISSGTVVVQNNAAFGAAGNSVTVQSGAALDLGGALAANSLNQGTRVFTVSGSGVGGSGVLTSTAANTQINAVSKVVLAGDATFGGAQRWDMRNNTPTLDMGGFTLTKTGANYLGLVGVAISNSGGVVVNQGELNLTFGSSFGGPGATNTVTVNNGGTLGFYQSSAIHGSALVLNNGAVLRGESGTGAQNTWAGSVTLSGNVTLKADGILNITGMMTESGVANVEKTGTSAAVLSAANGYSGATTITAGSLQIDHAGALGSSATITTSGADSASLTLGHGIVAGAGKTISVLGGGAGGNAFGALSSASSNMGTAKWEGDVIISATTAARVGTLAGNLWVSGVIGEFSLGSELIYRNNLANSTIRLTGANTYTGSSMVASGRVQVDTLANSGVASPLGRNGTIRLGLTNVNGGTLVYTGTGETTDKIIDLSSTTGSVAIDHSGTNLLKFTSSFTASGSGAKTLTLQGSTSGVGEIAGAIVNSSSATSLTKTGTGTWILSGGNTYTGATSVNAGLLKLDYDASNTSKLSDSGILTFGGGTLELAGGSHLEVVTSTTLATNSSSLLTRSSGTSVLSLNTVTRNGGATIDFAAENIARVDNTNTNGMLGGWGTVARTDWAVNSTNGADGLVTALSTYTLTSVAGNTAANYANNNISVDSSPTLGGVITANSLRFNDANARVLTLAAGNNVISTAGILVTPNVGANSSILTGGNLTRGSAGNIVFHQHNSGGKLTVGSVIANNGANVISVLKVGAGELEFTSTNTFTGGIIVNGGTLTLSGNQASQAGGVVVGAVAATGATLNIAGDLPMAANQSIALGQGNGAAAVINQTAGNVSFVTSGNQLLIGGASPGAAGTYNLSGGTLTTVNVANRGVMIGVNDGAPGNPITAVFNLSGTGVLNNAGVLQVVRGDSTSSYQNGIYNQTDGTSTNGTLLIGGNGGNGANSTATFRVTGGTFSATTFSNLSAGNNVASTITIGGTADVTLPAFPTARGMASTATLYLNGGTLRPAADSTTYLQGLTAAYIQAGGSTFNTSGKNITVNQALLEDAGSPGGGLTKTGSGTLTLGGNNTFAGAVTLSQGGITITHANALGTGAFVNDTNTNTLTNDSGAEVVLSNSSYSVGSSLIIGGSGSAANINTGTGAFTLPGSQKIVSVNTGVTFTVGGNLSGNLRKDGGGAMVLAGTGSGVGSLRVTTGVLQLTGTVASTSSLFLGHDSTGTTVGKFVLGGVGGAVNQTFASLQTTGGAQTSQSLVGGNASISTLTVNQSGNTTYAGTIGGAGMHEDNLALIKSGSGTLILTGNNSYIGATTVADGTLVVNGTHSGGGLIAVSAGATLGGVGIVAAVDIADGGTLAPGNSPGVFTASELTLHPASQLTFELGVPTVSPDPGSDYIAVLGDLTLDGALQVTGITGFPLAPALGDKWLLMSYSGGLTDNSLSVGAAPALPGGLGYAIDVSAPGEVFLTVVPEPAPAGMLVLGGLLLRALARRRQGGV